jgi:hypothetical protein
MHRSADGVEVPPLRVAADVSERLEAASERAVDERGGASLKAARGCSACPPDLSRTREARHRPVDPALLAIAGAGLALRLLHLRAVRPLVVDAPPVPGMDRWLAMEIAAAVARGEWLGGWAVPYDSTRMSPSPFRVGALRRLRRDEDHVVAADLDDVGRLPEAPPAPRRRGRVHVDDPLGAAVDGRHQGRDPGG